MKLSIFLLGILFASSPVAVLAQPMPIDTLDLSIEQGILLVLERDVPHAHGTSLILRAGASRNPIYVPLLKQVVDSWAPGGSSNIAHFGRSDHYRPVEAHTYAALYSLWLLGESDDYFRTNLYNWEEDYVLAYQSARILALNPTPEYLDELEQLCEESSNPNGSNYLWSALNMAQVVADQIDRYETLPSDGARARMVINEIAGRWEPYREDGRMNPSGSGWTEIDYSDQRFIMIWNWFRRLSREQPTLITNAIRNVSAHVRDLERGIDRPPNQAEKNQLQAWLRYMASLPIE